MTDKTLINSIAARIKRSAERLAVLVEHKAPDIIIENERQILFKALFDLPVNAEAQIALQKQRDAMYLEEQKFLHEHGYFKDIEEEIERGKDQ